MNTHILTIDVNGQREKILSFSKDVLAEKEALLWFKSYDDIFDNARTFSEAKNIAKKDAEEEGGDVILVNINQVECDVTQTEEPTECPSCGHEETEAGETQHDTGMAWRKVECQGCGAKWVEYFQFKDWEEVSGGNDE